MADSGTKVKTDEDGNAPEDIVKEENKPVVCSYCKRRLCIWVEFMTENSAFLSALHREVKLGERSGKARKTVFQRITRKMNGVMGAGVRKRLPQCVEDNVRSMFPSKDGQYMGYKEK